MMLRLLATLILTVAIQHAAMARCSTQPLQSYGRQIARTTATPSLNVRTAPSRSAPILATLPPGSGVVVMGRRGREWVEVVTISPSPECAEILGFVVREFIR